MRKYTEDLLGKLPKWARTEILTLEMRVKELEDKISQYSGSQQTNTYISEGLNK